MKAEYVTLLTVTISLLSGWGGAFIEGYFSRKASTDVIDKEYKLAIHKRKEKERIALLNLYVSLIRLDYEESPIEYNQDGTSHLDYHFFNNYVRPRIYDKYY